MHDGRLSGRTGARLAAALFVACGGVTLTTPLLPGSPGMNQFGIFGISGLAMITGVITWFLPWHRWRPQASLWLVPVTLALIAAFNALAGTDTYRYSLFFMVNAMWIGATQPRGTCLKFSPLLSVAYLTPLALEERPAWAMVSALYAVPVCVAAGETLGWVTNQLHRAHLELQQANLALQQSEERFRSLVQNASDVVSVLDSTGMVSYITPAVESVMGRTEAETMGTGGMTWLHPDDRERAGIALADLVGKPGGTSSIEVRSRHGDGSWRWLELRATNLLHRPAVEGVVINYRDVTERKRLEQQLVHQATHDLLSGLPNRALLIDRIGQALARRQGAPVALLFLDLDNFKLVNDNLGHGPGDQLIVAVADRLQACSRPGDTVARLGGDEFTLLLDAVTDARDAVEVAERIQEQLRVPIVLDGREVVTSASIGIALHTGDDDTPEALLRRADLAMYRAKLNGKGRCEIFNPQTGPDGRLEQQTEILSATRDLRHAA
jgi:diguanylate cyclase (GGDEF)-like protein/PAS domain S-box-containing protein